MTKFSIMAGIAALVAASLLPASAAFASGSVGGGASASRLGQTVYARKISCSGCPFAGGLKTPEQVRSATQMIDSGQIVMSDAERRAVKEYIVKRFKGN